MGTGKIDWSAIGCQVSSRRTGEGTEASGSGACYGSRGLRLDHGQMRLLPYGVSPSEEARHHACSGRDLPGPAGETR